MSRLLGKCSCPKCRMSMTNRMQQLEKVAEAARVVVTMFEDSHSADRDYAICDLRDTIRELEQETT